MTILRITKRPVGRKTYDAISASVDIEHRHPRGLIMHAVSDGDGTTQIAEVWDSEAFARRYDEQTLRPAIQAAGAPTEADVTVLQLHHLVTP
jgi:hypothetical protein